MTTARDDILARIAAALHDTTPQPAMQRAYHTSDPAPRAVQLERFAERVAEYKAHVLRVDEADLPAVIAERLQAHQIQRLVIPADIPSDWLPDGVTVLRDGPALSHAELDQTDGVLTGCALGIAQTGTIVLDHGAHQGRRALTLIPDYHLCVVRADHVVGLVPEAIERLEPAIRTRRPLTFISGPSATSDIELNRVEGVHGPRTLDVVIVGE